MLSELNLNGYYNKTVHSCVLKLHLPLAIINCIYKKLTEKNECAGVFYVDDNDKIIYADSNKGDATSVYTPNHSLNYHTHPIAAYRDGKTCFGSPSGEDYRETLKFALAGNKAHLVFTVEGLYVIQVNPCIIKKIRELLDDTERGILIFIIEIYFKTSHEFRCVDILNDLATRNININPYSFVDFVNTFDLSNLFTEEKLVFKTPNNKNIETCGHTGINSSKNIGLYTKLKKNYQFSRIPNMGFPEITHDYVTTKPINSFLTKGELHNLRKIDNQGNESPPENMSISELTNILKRIAEKFNTVPCSIEWNTKPNTWFFLNFFPTMHFINGVHMKNNSHIMPHKDCADLLYIPHEPFIRIFSNTNSGCKIKDMSKSSNFNMNKYFYLNENNNNNNKNCCCSFGKKCKNDELNSDINYLTNF